MELQARARQVCELFEAAAALRKAGRGGDARARSAEASDLIAWALAELDRRLGKITAHVATMTARNPGPKAPPPAT